MPQRRFSRALMPLALASTLALSALTTSATARATGMQGHIYMALCGAEISTDPRVKKIAAAHEMMIANGGMFPDSGYTSPDHDQGEIAHWEQYVEGNIRLIRDRFSPPYDEGEAAAHVAMLFGLAAHGITDSTFDTLLYPRADQVDPGPSDDIDMVADVFLVAQLNRHLVPELIYDAQAMSDIYSLPVVNHPVTPQAITKAMTTARGGIYAVSQFLYKSAPSYEKEHPWEAAALLDPRTPGGYPFGARVVARYYEEILRRLDGDTSADKGVIGVYPDEAYPLASLKVDRPESRVLFFFGTGLDRASVDEASAEVYGPDDAPVPVDVSFFRGDDYPNVISLSPKADWQPGTTYRVVLKSTIKNLYGVSPKADHELTFTTCMPDATGDCPAPTGEAPPSICPVNHAGYQPEPEVPEGEGGQGGGGAAGEAAQGGEGGAVAMGGGAGAGGKAGPGGAKGDGGAVAKGGEGGAAAMAGEGGAVAMGGATGDAGAASQGAPQAEASSSDEGGCSVSGRGAGPGAIWALLLAGLAARRRRR